MAKRSNTSETEKLDDSTLQRVIELLEGENKITKKAACEMLCISYNTTRLNSLIEKFKEKKDREKKLRAQKRGTAFSKDEIRYAVSSYLEGNSIESISNSLHRSTASVVHILDSLGVPRRQKRYDYNAPALIPDQAVKTSFQMGEKCYSVRYDSLCVIESYFPHKDERCYRIWLLGDRWQQYAYQPASDLASLEHLKEYL
jgi:hypothetical protein